MRDAACYVCWAFARAYRPEVMRPHVATLAPSLISVAVFDREVNCRRAASAAFQENVGRQGEFPNGISIVQLADFHAVGNIRNAFLDVAPEIARQFPAAYADVFARFLYEEQLVHWDSEVRVLAARALGLLVPYAGDFIRTVVLPGCVERSTKTNFEIRHGAMFAVAEIVAASGGASLDEQARKDVAGLPNKLRNGRYYRGVGQEPTRIAFCRLVTCMAEAELDLAALDPTAHAAMQVTLLECLQSPGDVILPLALEALRSFVTGDLPVDDAAVLAIHLLDVVITSKLPGDAIEMRGAAAGLGVMPEAVLEQVLPRLLADLGGHGSQLPLRAAGYCKDVEVRRHVVRSLVTCSVTCGFAPGSPALAAVRDLVLVLADGLNDYTNDKRGDVGSWVRLAAVSGTRDLIGALAAAGELDSLREDAGGSRGSLAEVLTGRLLQQSVEKMDKVRDAAGSALAAVIAMPGFVACLPAADSALLAASVGAVAADIMWSRPAETFVVHAEMLRSQTPALLLPLVKGLVSTVGA